MNRNHLYSGVALGLLAALMAALPAQAQQSTAETPIVLEPINAEGGGNDDGPAGENGDEKPTVATKQKTVLTTRVTREELDAEQVTDFRDIGRLAPGVSFSNVSRSFNVRGLNKTRVLTTIDGIRIPWIEDGARGLVGGSASFDFNSLSGIDLIKGSDSTVFGSGALGGVVALRTLEPEDLIEPGNTFGGLTKSGYDSRDKSWGIDQAIAGRVDGTFFMVQGGYRNGEETETKGNRDIDGIYRTEADPLDYDQENLLVKLKQHVDGGHVFGLTGEIFNREENIDNLSAATTATPPTTPTYVLGTPFKDDITKRQRVSGSYSYDGGGFFDAANAIVYWQRQQLEDDFSAVRRTTPIGDYRRDTTREQEIFGASGSVLKEFVTGDIGHAVSFGGELFGSKASSYSAGEDTCGPGPFPPFNNCNFLHTNQADMPDVDGTTFGAFIQDEIAFLGGQVRLTPGLRYDWYEEKPQDTPEYEDNPNYDGTLPPASSDDKLSGKLRLEGDAAENLILYAQWAQAFRAPTANELYLDYGGPGTYLRLGNPDLKPETSNGFDVGAIAGDKNFGGTVSAFYNRYKNFIDEGEATPSTEYPLGITPTINRANVEIYGFELTAHAEDESGWHGWGKFGIYKGRDIDEDYGLNTIPAAKLVLGVGYATDQWGADLIVTAAARRDFTCAGALTPPPPSTPLAPPTCPAGAADGSDLENLPSETPSYQTVDFTAWWSPRQVEGLTIRAGIYNIFDELYYEDGFDLTATTPNQEMFTEPGRNARVTATYKF
jgi:hemoglobin/transferrin/lactoferrin receptor protein